MATQFLVEGLFSVLAFFHSREIRSSPRYCCLFIGLSKHCIHQTTTTKNRLPTVLLLKLTGGINKVTSRELQKKKLK
jgi:hypothetical protein